MKTKDNCIYKIGDRVFDYLFGWGTIISVSEDFENIGHYGVQVKFDRKELGIKNFSRDGKFNITSKNPSLSFTEYNFVTGGFSQKRPLNLKKGQLIYVKFFSSNMWVMKFFHHQASNGTVYVYPAQNKTGHPIAVSTYSITNPLEEKEDSSQTKKT